MRAIDSVAGLRELRRAMKGTVGFVPTMGFLHEGHMSLVKLARDAHEAVVVSIFVNPTQFGPDEDLEAYPRDIERDLAMLEKGGVDLVFIPTPALIYPAGFQTYVFVEQVTKGLEGAHRPGHFKGVATVVNKLLNLVQPDCAYFGQKDAQQVVVIKQMVRDLNMPVKIVVGPVVREADGLAMSSRNVYLSSQERKAATVLSRAWKAAGKAYETGERDPDTLRQIARELVEQAPLATLDYVSVADASTLEELNTPTDNPMLLSMTAKVGKPRLLDNCLLPLSLNTSEGASRVLGGDT